MCEHPGVCSTLISLLEEFGSLIPTIFSDETQWQVLIITDIGLTSKIILQVPVQTQISVLILRSLVSSSIILLILLGGMDSEYITCMCLEQMDVLTFLIQIPRSLQFMKTHLCGIRKKMALSLLSLEM